MSTDFDFNSDSDDVGSPNTEKSKEQVVDEDGTVSQQHKKAILKARDRVDEREDALFTGPLIEPDIGRNIDYGRAVMAWGRTVRTFIRRLRPLLIRGSVEGADKYAEEVELGTFHLPPPDKDEYEFSRVQRDGLSDNELRSMLGLPRSAEIPEPKPFEFNGLLSILQVGEELTAQWSVKISDDGPDPQHEYLYLERTVPIPKFILENAVMLADEFMQESGIGVQLGRGDPHGKV